MKRIRKFSTVMLIILSLNLILACGSGDENITPIESHEVNQRDEAIKDLCKKFGINADDYYNYWEPQTVGDKIIISLARKADNRVFVAIYDTSRNAVIYRNSDISFSTTMIVNSYEDKFEVKLAHILPRYGETKEGFVMNILVFYTESGENSPTVYSEKKTYMQTLIFNDGITTRMKSLSATETPYVDCVKWFDNSCLLLKQYEGNACYSVKGDILWENKPINDVFQSYQTPLCSIISNNEYILFKNSYDRIGVGRYDVQKVSENTLISVWHKELNLIDNYTSDIKVEISIEDSKTSIWTLSAKFIWENGTVKTVRFKLNIETGEYTI